VPYANTNQGSKAIANAMRKRMMSFRLEFRFEVVRLFCGIRRFSFLYEPYDREDEISWGILNCLTNH
jgi:hypothetical protein